MKIEELSIGNLVSYRGKIYSIFSISSSETVELYDYISNIFSCHINELDPIKLTEELLIKNGFFHDFDTEVAYPDDSMFLVSPDKQITLHNAKDYINSENIWSIHIDNSDFNSVANCELSYVHQLQNLCTLVNYNLKLDAFL
jgi:hypothetical protein